eukprot:scaffold459540_cov18-Prasinocladus_malaysianus.AAC.1
MTAEEPPAILPPARPCAVLHGHLGMVLCFLEAPASFMGPEAAKRRSSSGGGEEREEGDRRRWSSKVGRRSSFKP